MNNIELEIEAVVRRVVREEMATVELSGREPSNVEEAQKMKDELNAIKAKEFVRIPEAAALLNCSSNHLRNLVDQTKKGKTKTPIPFRDLDGVTVFSLAELLEWTKKIK